MSIQDERGAVFFLKEDDGFMMVIEHDGVRVEVDFDRDHARSLAKTILRPPAEPFQGFHVMGSAIRSSYHSHWLGNTLTALALLFVAATLWHAAGGS